MSGPLEVHDRDSSPFDKIRHFRPDGTEYWSARELMPYLGYVNWQNMEGLIERARQTCINLGKDPADHFEVFTASGKNSKLGGRPGLDVQMARYGCYITALCGDSHKKEVAPACHYFAVMTRAQEVAKQSPAQAVHTGPVLAMCELLMQTRHDQIAGTAVVG